jgi:hypothetical protein
VEAAYKPGLANDWGRVLEIFNVEGFLHNQFRPSAETLRILNDGLYHCDIQGAASQKCLHDP